MKPPRKTWHQNFSRASKGKRSSSAGGEVQVFDSAAERKRFEELSLLQKYGKIKDLQTQVPFILATLELEHMVMTPTGRPARYTADFVYYDIEHNEEVIEDVKGYADPFSLFRITVFEALTGKTVTIISKKKSKFL